MGLNLIKLTFVLNWCLRSFFGEQFLSVCFFFFVFNVFLFHINRLVNKKTELFFFCAICRFWPPIFLFIFFIFLLLQISWNKTSKNIDKKRCFIPRFYIIAKAASYTYIPMEKILYRKSNYFSISLTVTSIFYVLLSIPVSI